MALLTGDHAEVAEPHRGRRGHRHRGARCNPEQKAAWIADRQRAGQRVLFAGDGLNDGPALAQADVGIAMGSGAASSVLVADGVIARPSLAPILAARRVARSLPADHPQQPAPVAGLQRAGGIGRGGGLHQSAGRGAAHAAVQRARHLGRAPGGAPRAAGRPVNAIIFLLPIALVLGGIFAALFLRAVKKGQFDDLDDPPQRMLQERD